VVVSGTLPNASVVGLKPTVAPLEAIPIPVIETECGLPTAELVKVRNADSTTPVCDGVNVTEAVQLADAASVPPHVLEGFAKSARLTPPIVKPESVTVPELTFVTVTVRVVVVATT
jgi:hypothetical protein